MHMNLAVLGELRNKFYIEICRCLLRPNHFVVETARLRNPDQLSSELLIKRDACERDSLHLSTGFRLLMRIMKLRKNDVTSHAGLAGVLYGTVYCLHVYILAAA